MIIREKVDILSLDGVEIRLQVALQGDLEGILGVLHDVEDRLCARYGDYLEDDSCNAEVGPEQEELEPEQEDLRSGDEDTVRALACGRWVTSAEIAEALRVPPRNIRTYISRRRYPWRFRLGERVREYCLESCPIRWQRAIVGG